MNRGMIFLVIAIMVLTPGCVSENTFPEVTRTQISSITSPVTTLMSTVPEMTAVPTLSESYKSAREGFELNKYPQYGFTMDYPSDWTYHRLDTKYDKGGFIFLKTGESIMYPKSYVIVFYDDLSSSGGKWYPMDTWANNTIHSKTESYCLDGAGNPMNGDYCPSQRTMYHPYLASNSPVSVQGTINARKLVFRSYDDRNYGQCIVYLMHSGRMQGYNYTIPDEPAAAVTVDGPVWDYAMGGQGYAIEFYSSTDQINATSRIFDHMIASFETTVKL